MIDAIAFATDKTDHYEDVSAARDAEGTTWIRVFEADNAELQRVADAFGIHSLSVEDIQHDVRPKTEEYSNHTFILVKTATLQRGETAFDEEISSRQVGLFVGDDWLVTMSTERLPAVEQVWNAVVEGDSRLRQFGPDYAAYRALDRIVDDYFGLLDQIEDDIEAIEDEILDGANPEVLEALNTVRRDLLSFRKVLWPMREAVSVLARGDPEYVRERTEKYYRDVYDHLVQLVDLTETYRELAGGSRDIYLNTVSQSTNEVMKTLTVVATIILPLTFIAGVFGMNFADAPFNMPELAWPYGYPAVMLGMGGVSLILLVYFRREGWL